jgi:hydrogenase-4 component F
MYLLIILAIPLLLALLAGAVKNVRLLGVLNACGHAAVLVVALAVALALAAGPTWSLFHFFFADALSGFFIFTIAVVSFAAALYSTGFIEDEVRRGTLSPAKARMYYMLFDVFVFTMFLVTMLDNLGFVWVAIEMTTLVSALLVGFYNDKKSVEAAWKYLILCSVGITLALLGTVLYYYTLSVHAGIKSLNWTDMLAAAPRLDPKVLKVAFIFILVGYGTKAGIAPMHTWLPDAHSQAPAPISALLSGVLLKTSLYAIMRFMIITNRSLGTAFASHLLLFFGLLSLAIAAGFILVQKDLKRLLAYSSIEHVGVIAVGLGIGGPAGYFGALFHAFNHAVTKSLMFFGAGSIVKKYGTHNMNLIRGAAKALPFTGILVLVGAFALAGSPPFSIFFSEITIAAGGFASGHFLAVSLFLLFIAVVFGGLVYHMGRIVLGKKPDDVAVSSPAPGELAACAFLLIFILLFGVAMPGLFRQILGAASGVLQ